MTAPQGWASRSREDRLRVRPFLDQAPRRRGVSSTNSNGGRMAPENRSRLMTAQHRASSRMSAFRMASTCSPWRNSRRAPRGHHRCHHRTSHRQEAAYRSSREGKAWRLASQRRHTRRRRRERSARREQGLGRHQPGEGALRHPHRVEGHHRREAVSHRQAGSPQQERLQAERRLEVLRRAGPRHLGHPERHLLAEAGRHQGCLLPRFDHR